MADVCAVNLRQFMFLWWGKHRSSSLNILSQIILKLFTHAYYVLYNCGKSAMIECIIASTCMIYSTHSEKA